ncbi:hypothetical protein ASPCAL08200 [Aspergillus calidoustus]|uniref:CWH43-like N-terminal domain-containing protein n=1 Tax=Aspergillus calidoustus TaxID=454130 RepID=A0A0U5GRI3_ASPCI|nr:hypothetical protein ASPCAL08200 [Aspergillus calidoustus]
MWIISFWIFPVISACMWLAMLAAMLGTWCVQGQPIYPSMESGQTIAYISDVGAQGLKPLFITGSVITVVFLDLSFISERWLRHAGQLVPNRGWFDKSCAIGSIFFSFAGAAGLILLSIFDTVNHSRLHVSHTWSALSLSALNTSVWESSTARITVFSSSVSGSRRSSSWLRLLWQLPLVSADGIALIAGTQRLCLIIALVFTFYVLSFIIDLLPSVRTRNHVPQGEKRIDTPRSEQPGMVYEEPLTQDSMGPNANTSANYYREPRSHHF